MTDKTPTERLRELLDERGVEWHEVAGITYFGRSEYDTLYAANEYECGIVLDPLTPEQAIEATLGRGTCRNSEEVKNLWFCCSECGCDLEYVVCGEPISEALPDGPRYCPNCGRKVVEEL